MAGYPVHRRASASDHAGSGSPHGARLGHVIRTSAEDEGDSGTVTPLRRRNNTTAAHSLEPHCGRKRHPVPRTVPGEVPDLELVRCLARSTRRP
jgi:hypothetical protein